MPSGSFNEHLNIAGHDKGAVYTYTGTVLGGLALTGLDPSSVTEPVRKSISAILRNVFQLLPADVTVSEYYLHHEGAKVKLADRKHPRSQMLSKRRQSFSNKVRNLNNSFLYWVIEIAPTEDLNSVFSLSFAKNLFNSAFDAEARKRIALVFSEKNAFKIEMDEFDKQCRKLQETLRDLDLRLSFFSPDNVTLDVEGIWRLSKFMANFNPRYLKSKPCPVPAKCWDQYTLDAGGISSVTIDGVPMLKIEAAEPVYVRIASILQQGKESVPEAVWASDASGTRPTLLRGNYVYFNRFKTVSAFKRSLILTSKENELFRSQLRFSDLMANRTGEEKLKQKVNENPHLKKMQDELMDASNSPDRIGEYLSSIAVFNTDPYKLIDAAKEVDRVVSDSMTVVWEGVGLEDAYLAMQVGSAKSSYRSMIYNSSQVGAASLFYRSHQGIKTWQKGFETEEAVYIFESDDGVLFYYTPVVGEKMLVIGVGPTRSGKSFLKNVIASHFAKLGGMYSAIDIDQGTIPVANFFQEDGAAFTLSDEAEQGFNCFAMAESEDDQEFIEHLVDQIKMMAKFNEREDDRYLKPEETTELVEAIKMRLRNQFSEQAGMLSANTLSSLMQKCSPGIRSKMAMFFEGGIYAKLFDNAKDAIGVIDKTVSVYNLAAVKDNHKVAQLIQHEIFFRIVRLFESPKYREVPKILDIDEAQYSLSVPGAADWAIRKSRTWFKHGGGMSFWTQTPSHYSNLKEWETLRSSASVFIFMADPNGSTKEYMDTFGISADQVEIIKNLKRARQAFIIIPEAQIAKVINLIVESEQYAICTSTAHEAAMAQRIYQETDNIDEAVNRIVEGLNLPATPLETDEEMETLYL
ncbi:VirB4 family type IV secretion system protein [Scandinavium goeteborgense]|uniref:Type IV secretion system protein VirB4 n=1 Tax=Scandinavium goeteborgense TaxID=1851514 RepID=A0A4R6DTS3_SCAGO|nr:VirB4 family type IV secretion system protein [Scandinavium goeteborgense]TDN48074.1 type IV secretion system protein VirB4 [Scandinavium goeteborgense]